MKILGIKLSNHPILGTKNLNFSYSKKYPYGMVVFAGENGVGKSTLIELIHGLCSLTVPQLVKNEYREITMSIDLQEINSIRYPGGVVTCLEKIKTDSIITFGFDYNISPKLSHFYISVGDEEKRSCQDFLKSIHSKRILRTTYLYRGTIAHEINNVSSEKKKQHKFLNPSNSAIVTAEDIIFNYFLEKGKEIKLYQGMGEFNKKLFDKGIKNDYDFLNTLIKEILPDISIHGILEKEKKVLMKKNGNIFSFSLLSSGEKRLLEIVSSLIFGKDGYNGAPILIDEPENSLHPKLQLKFRSFLKKLVSKDKQIFVVTHSPFIIHEKGQIGEKVLIFKRIKNEVVINEFGEFYAWNRVRKVNESFRISYLFEKLKTRPVLLVEGETDEMYLKEVKKLYFKKYNLDIKWVGYYNNGTPSFTGTNGLNNVKEFVKSNPEIIPNKIMLLYDCDKNMNDCKVSKNLFIMGLKLNPHNKLMDKGIENSLILPESINMCQFYSVKEESKSYGQVNTIRTFEKRKFASHICSLSRTEKSLCLENLRLVMSEIVKRIC